MDIQQKVRGARIIQHFNNEIYRYKSVFIYLYAY